MRKKSPARKASPSRPFRRVEGRLNGFYKDVVLLEQPSVADNKKSVKQLMDAAGATLTGFVRFEVGQN